MYSAATKFSDYFPPPEVPRSPLPDMADGEEAPRTLAQTGRARTNTPERTRRRIITADMGIAAQGRALLQQERPWAEDLNLALASEAERQDTERKRLEVRQSRDLQNMVDRMVRAEALQEQRHEEMRTALTDISKAMEMFQRRLVLSDDNPRDGAPVFPSGNAREGVADAGTRRPFADADEGAAVNLEGAGGSGTPGASQMRGETTRGRADNPNSTTRAGTTDISAGVAGVPRARTTSAVPVHTTATSGGMPATGTEFLTPGKEIKIPALPVLGKAPGLSYPKWSKVAKIKLGTAGMGAVLDPQWIPSTSDEDLWWKTVNPLVFAVLYDAVQGKDTLCDKVARFHKDEGAGRLAWNAIKAYHVRIAEGNKEVLLQKVTALIPGSRESMESFLCRCENLREEFQEYNLNLDESLLISHLFGCIDQTWRWLCGFADIPTEALTWEDVSEALLKQDNQRRNATKPNPLILPLGWIARDTYDKSKEGAAHAAQGSRFVSPKEGNPKYPSAGPNTSSGPQKESFFICFCCFEFGHSCDKCPKKPPHWKLTNQAKAKAMKLRNEKVEKYGKAKMAQGENSSPVL